MKAKKVKLIPPDKKQCQHQTAVGAWPDAMHFMNLGPASLHRCTNRPSVIVAERKPDKKDGLCGSMSLCPTHLTEFMTLHNCSMAKLSKKFEITKL